MSQEATWGTNEVLLPFNAQADISGSWVGSEKSQCAFSSEEFHNSNLVSVGAKHGT
jgi:hypothetical protein